jgi:hypothetical protein
MSLQAFSEELNSKNTDVSDTGFDIDSDERVPF